MKKTILLLAFLGFSALLFSQNFTIQTDTTWANVDLETEDEFGVNIYNNLAGSINLTWEIVNNTLPTSWGLQICDNKACYELEIPEVSDMNPIVEEGFGFLKVTVKPGHFPGYGRIEFLVYETENPDETQLVVYMFNAGGVSIEEQNTNAISVYPNPANDILNVNFENDVYTNFTIVNGLGQMVLQEINTNQRSSLDIQNLDTGIYFLQLSNANGNIEIVRFVKE